MTIDPDNLKKVIQSMNSDDLKAKLAAYNDPEVNKLNEVFDEVIELSGNKDWKAPIDLWIESYKWPMAFKAVVFATGTELKIVKRKEVETPEGDSETYYLCHADGYTAKYG